MLGRIGLFLAFTACAEAQALPKFTGREVTINRPALDDSGFFPKGPASVCVEGSPRLCYTAPDDYGRDPDVAVIQVTKTLPALLFTVAGGGVSGFPIHFALLVPGKKTELENLLRGDMTLSEQSEHDFWVDSSISDGAIFATADYVWGPDDSHHGSHRYIISAYLFVFSMMLQEKGYYLFDRYMTVRTYDEGTNKILSSEKQEILTRLRRLKQQTKR